MIRCAIIGCGHNVEDLHIPALRALKDIQIVAACDLDHGRLGTFGETYGISNLYSGLEELLDADTGADFLIISTPGFTHYELCRQALEAGHNLLVEKPVTLSLRETMELRELASRRGAKVCVIQNYRYRDNVLKARDDINKGRVGTVTQVNVTFHGQSVFGEPTPWLWEERKNKTLVYEICLHYLDLQVLFAGRATRIIGVESSWSEALGSTEKICALVEHENGAIGFIDLQFNASSNYTQVEVFASANDILLKFFPEYYRIYSGNVNPLDELYLDAMRIVNFAVPVFMEKLVKPRVTRRAKSHYRLFKAFVDALREGRPVPVSLDDIIPTMELAEEMGNIAY